MIINLYPEYRVSQPEGEDKKFFAQVLAWGRVIGQGEGRNKKAATTEAARQALLFLSQDSDKIETN